LPCSRFAAIYIGKAIEAWGFAAMSDKPAADPTMDEILASIRRIISEEPAPRDHAEITAVAEPDDGMLGLDPQRAVEANYPEVAEAVEDPIHEEPMTDHPSSADEPLVGDAAANASASAFETLAASAHDTPAMALPAPGRTLEDLTAELLRPLLKAWLDENLPEIVRDRVDEEVRRIARSRVR
jgi:cell pole-organizing protein PopZ